MLINQDNKNYEMYDKIIYVSPSKIPSRSANSIHVINQCNALAKNCRKILLYCESDNECLNSELITYFYGIELEENIDFKNIHINYNKAKQLKIAIYALYDIFRNNLQSNLIISRNFYMSLILTLLRFRHLYETHAPESNKIKKVLQNIILRNNKVICISESLSNILKKQCKSCLDIKVMHDAAAEFTKVGVSQHLVINDRFRAGYFGHLYPGRGIEIIIELARQLPEIDFYVVGGDEESIVKVRKEVNLENLKVIGHLRYNEARSLMHVMDVLLMPYQNIVSIGIANSDTSKWMSPLKMFEYMSSRKPIISSDLPVLREVLEDGNNAILVECDDVNAWREALLSLKCNSILRKKISVNSYNQYLARYTWSGRARLLIDYSRKIN